jgi:hypothetical protein
MQYGQQYKGLHGPLPRCTLSTKSRMCYLFMIAFAINEAFCAVGVVSWMGSAASTCSMISALRVLQKCVISLKLVQPKKELGCPSIPS